MTSKDAATNLVHLASTQFTESRCGSPIAKDLHGGCQCAEPTTHGGQQRLGPGLGCRFAKEQADPQGIKAWTT